MVVSFDVDTVLSCDDTRQSHNIDDDTCNHQDRPYLVVVVGLDDDTDGGVGSVGSSGRHRCTLVGLTDRSSGVNESRW